MSHGTEQMFCPCLYHKVCGIIYSPFLLMMLAYRWMRHFSSTYLKAQVSFSDHLLSIVSPSVCLSVNLSHFQLLLQNYWAIFTRTWQNHPCMCQGVKVVPIKGHALSQGDSKNILTKFKNYPLQNNRSNFNQTWYKAFLGKGNL